MGVSPLYSGLKPEETPLAFWTGFGITLPQLPTAVSSQVMEMSPGRQEGEPSSIILANPKNPVLSAVASKQLVTKAGPFIGQLGVQHDE